ncbi:hypothetical protein D3C84_879280 [compost metagenome]
MYGQQASAAAATAGVELDPEQAKGINTKPDSARCKSRLVIQQKSLGPLGSLALRRPCRFGTQAMLVAEILIEIDVAQLQLELAVVDKAFCTGTGQRQQTKK